MCVNDGLFAAMEFVETEIFAKSKEGIFNEDSLLDLQIALLENPASGKLIPGGGELRKLRWAASGRGTRGGARVIYYWISDEKILTRLLQG